MPPPKLKPLQLRAVERRAASRSATKTTSGSADQQRRGRPSSTGELLPGLHPAGGAPRRGSTIADATPTATSATSVQPNPAPEDRLRQEEAAVVEERRRRRATKLSRGRRQRLEHGDVPEQELQQQRDVADQSRHRPPPSRRDQPVRRQPRDADEEAEDGREDDAEPGDQQRVEQADAEGAAVGRGRRSIGDQRLADVEAGGVVPGSRSPMAMFARAQVVDGVADDPATRRESTIDAHSTT